MRLGSGPDAGKKPFYILPIMLSEAQQYQGANLPLSMFDGGDMALRNADRLCDIRLFGIQAPEFTNPATDCLPIDNDCFL
jgi:hypothetical protein